MGGIEAELGARHLQCGKHLGFLSTDLELFVTEVGDDFKEASEGGDIAVEDVDAGKFAVLDLADTSDGHSHCLGDLALGQAASLAHVSESACANLGDEPGRAALDVLTTDRLDVLVADVRPAQGAHGGGSCSAAR